MVIDCLVRFDKAMICSITFNSLDYTSLSDHENAWFCRFFSKFMHHSAYLLVIQQISNTPCIAKAVHRAFKIPEYCGGQMHMFASVNNPNTLLIVADNLIPMLGLLASINCASQSSFHFYLVWLNSTNCTSDVLFL